MNDLQIGIFFSFLISCNISKPITQICIDDFLGFEHVLIGSYASWDPSYVHVTCKSKVNDDELASKKH